MQEESYGRQVQLRRTIRSAKGTPRPGKGVGTHGPSAIKAAFPRLSSGQARRPSRRGGLRTSRTATQKGRDATPRQWREPPTVWIVEEWSGRVDLNHRPPGPDPGALARLSHAPNFHFDCTTVRKCAPLHRMPLTGFQSSQRVHQHNAKIYFQVILRPRIGAPRY